MAKNNNIIEINGRRYDARSGEPLDGGASKTVQPAATAAKPTAHPAVPAKPVHQAVKRPTMHDVVRAKPKQAAARKPQPAKTLMRSAVKKPSDSLKRHVKAQSHTGALVKQPAIAAKPSVARLDEKRLKVAKRIPKSELVSHFGAASQTSSFQPVYNQPAPQPISFPKPAVSGPPTTADILQHALEQANSHRQAAPKRPRRNRLGRISGLSAAAMGLTLLAGFAVSHNLTGAKLQVASAKAGFAASLPGYQPAGYSVGELHYSPGVVAINYQSNSDQRHYTLTEKQSSWDSEALQDLFVASNGQSYQKVEAGGRTIFIYGQHDATWVSGGIWYQVHTDGALSDRQLIDLALSL